MVFEIDSESSILEEDIFWKKEAVERRDSKEETEQVPQFVIEDDDEDAAEGEGGTGGSQPKRTSPHKVHHAKTLPSLAERLFSCLIDLLFCCGFTLPSKIQVDHYKINYIIWCVPLYLNSPWLGLNVEQGEGRRLDCGSRT